MFAISRGGYQRFLPWAQALGSVVHDPIWRRYPSARKLQSMRGTIGQQRTDSACYIQWCLATVQMTKAQFKRTLVFDRRAQAIPPSRFKHNGCYTIIAPLGH